MNVKPGQVWRSSDPRRLSCFCIVSVIRDVCDGWMVDVVGIYPNTKPRWLPLASFGVTGPKGYTRMS